MITIVQQVLSAHPHPGLELLLLPPGVADRLEGTVFVVELWRDKHVDLCMFSQVFSLAINSLYTGEVTELPL